MNELSEEESRHAAVTLRLRRGDGVVLFDGSGHEGHGAVEQIDRRMVRVRVATIENCPFDTAYRLTLAVAMGKGNRQGYLIEKCTELGVAAIWPILAERSVTRPGDIAVEKWSRRAIEAAKQSGRSWVPPIESPQSLEVAIARSGEFTATALADPIEDGIAFHSFLAARQPGSEILVFVGPEGGWSDAERDGARKHGVPSVRLAPTILRVETAAIAVCAAVSMISIGDRAYRPRGASGAREESC